MAASCAAWPILLASDQTDGAKLTRVTLAMDDAELIEAGLRSAEIGLDAQNRIWCEHSDEKLDDARGLMSALRVLHRLVAVGEPLSGLSIGSSEAPQLPLMQAACQKHLLLYDIDRLALERLKERLHRQFLKHVTPVVGDYTLDFSDAAAARRSLQDKLSGQAMHLVILHHSLYYDDFARWPALFEALHSVVMAPRSILHAVMMSATASGEETTTALYNRFVGRYFGQSTDQDLVAFGQSLKERPGFEAAVIGQATREVRFWADDFHDFMAPVWMIMLYPHVFNYSLEQRREITAYVLQTFWRQQRPLVQVQDYLTLVKGAGSGGLGFDPSTVSIA